MVPSDWLPLLTASVFAAGLAGLIVWGWLVKRRTPYTLPQAVIAFLNAALCRILWRAEVVGRIDIPPDQGAVIACNHRGAIDPVFFQLVSDRVVSWFVAREYCEMPVVGQMLAVTKVIPTNRTSIDTRAIRQAMRTTAEGGFVGMLPEGRINTTSRLLLPARPGVAKVALSSRVPVVPCFTFGIPYKGNFWDCLLMPGKVRIVIGEPLDFSEFFGRENDREALVEVTKRVMRRLAALGGDPNFEPEMAGPNWKHVQLDKSSNQREPAGSRSA